MEFFTWMVDYIWEYSLSYKESFFTDGNHTFEEVYALDAYTTDQQTKMIPRQNMHNLITGNRN